MEAVEPGRAVKLLVGGGLAEVVRRPQELNRRVLLDANTITLIAQDAI